MDHLNTYQAVLVLEQVSETSSVSKTLSCIRKVNLLIETITSLQSPKIFATSDRFLRGRKRARSRTQVMNNIASVQLERLAHL